MLVMIKSSTKPPIDAGTGVEKLPPKLEDLKPLLRLLSGESFFGEQGSIGYMVLKALTLLSRHEHNRKQFTEPDVARALSLLSNPVSKFRLEAALLVRNLCHDQEKVRMTVDLAGSRALLHLLRNPNEKPDSRAAAAAALQSITYRHTGRMSVLEFDGLAAALGLVHCKYTTLRTRAIGLLRNLTVDIRTATRVYEAGAVESLCSLLCSCHAEETGYAAGVIQNLSRHNKARILLLKGQAVSLLSRLALTSTHLPAQVAAVCALCNLLSPGLGTGFSGFKRRRLLKNVLSDALALGIIGSALLTTGKNEPSIIKGGWTALALPAFRRQIAVLEGHTESAVAAKVGASETKHRDANKASNAPLKESSGLKALGPLPPIVLGKKETNR